MEKKHKWYRGGLTFALCLVLAGGVGSAMAQEGNSTTTQEEIPVVATEAYPEEMSLSKKDLWDWASTLEESITQPAGYNSEACTCNQDADVMDEEMTAAAMQTGIPDETLCDDAFHCADAAEMYPQDEGTTFDAQTEHPLDSSKLSDVERYALYSAYQEMDRLYEALFSNEKKLSESAFDQRMEELTTLIAPLEQKMQTGETAKEDYAADDTVWAEDNWTDEGMDFDTENEGDWYFDYHTGTMVPGDVDQRDDEFTEGEDEWYFDYHTGTMVTITSDEEVAQDSEITLEMLKDKAQHLQTLLSDARIDQQQQKNLQTELEDLRFFIEQFETSTETSNP